MICYHGGPPGLKIGWPILPADATGARSTAEFGAKGVCDTGKVYVTTDPGAAAMFAAMHPSGDGRVYKVRTVGAVEHDPDCREAGLSYTCESAVIVGRVRVKGKVLRRIRKMMLAGTGPSQKLLTRGRQ